MTAALATAGTVLLCAAIAAPFSLLWIPGFGLILFAWRRHTTRHERWARRRQGARAGWIRTR